MKRFFTVWFVVAVSALAFADYSRTTTYSYDALGNVTVRTDAEERAQRTTYDVLGRPVGQVDALNHTNTVSYGVLGQMEGLADANGNQTAWAFDPLGQLLTKTYDDPAGGGAGTQVHYTYDAAGRLESRRDASGGYTTYQYDALGQLRTNRFYTATNGTLDRQFVYTYDNLGRMLTATDHPSTGSGQATNTYVFAYDDTQNKQTVTVDYGSGVTMTSVYSYNQQTKQMTRINGGVTNIYSYNADGQLLSVSIPGEGTVSYQYDARGLNTEIILPGGIRRIQSYDGFGQLESVQVKDAANNDVLTQSYQRSLTGSLQTKTTGSGVWNYRYDLTDQLTNAMLSALGGSSSTSTYSYDAMGNRLFNRESTQGTQKETAYEPNSLNQYLSIAASVSSVTSVVNNLLYDLNGNLTNDSIRAYSWDLRNQLVEVETLPNAQSLRTKVTFSYDYMGRRIQKEVYTRVADAWSLTSDHWFFYDGWNLVREDVYDNSTTPILQYSTTYTWGNDLSGSLQGAGGVGGLLCSVRSQSGSSPQAFFYTYDHNGNVEKVISGSGAVVAEYQYDAFGNTIQESLASGLTPQAFPVRFSTKYFDSETGLAYYGYRYYSPGKGRWINRDPAEEEGGLNLYCAVNNTMVNRVDFLGMWDITDIPSEMLAKAWFVSARLMNVWFSRPVAIAPAYSSDEYVNIDWTLRFQRAQTAYNTLINRLTSIEGKNAIKRKFGRESGEFGGYRNGRSVYENQTQYSAVKKLEMDDLGGSLGRYAYYAAPNGIVLDDGSICVTSFDIAIRDSYDFNDGSIFGSQPLGLWGPDNTYVNNKSFRAWRSKHGRGGDFLVFSDVKNVPEVELIK